ncbi:MAG: hypothetical protein ACLQDC_02560 [Verrucomicrobiia bacterium]
MAVLFEQPHASSADLLSLAEPHGCANTQAAMGLSIEDFQHEIAAAAKSYDKFVVCVEKTPDEFLKSLQSLMGKAINAFENRAPGLRHGIALDRHVTIMLSQNDDARPLCGVYFNLHSPFRKKSGWDAARP